MEGNGKNVAIASKTFYRARSTSRPRYNTRQRTPSRTRFSRGSYGGGRGGGGARRRSVSKKPVVQHTTINNFGPATAMAGSKPLKESLTFNSKLGLRPAIYTNDANTGVKVFVAWPTAEETELEVEVCKLFKKMGFDSKSYTKNSAAEALGGIVKPTATIAGAEVKEVMA